jgi:hypothetical protein
MTPRSVDEMASGPRKREGGGGRGAEEAKVGEGDTQCVLRTAGWWGIQARWCGQLSMPCACPILATHIPAPQPTAMPKDPGRTGEILQGSARRQAGRDP